MMQGCGIETCLKKPFNALNMLRQIEMVIALSARGEVKGAGYTLQTESDSTSTQAVSAQSG
jgi:hypothetical protein